MEATAEISLYPLENSEFREVILEFIQNLKSTPGLTVETNGLSTQIFGEFNIIMQCITKELEKVFEQETAIMVLKIGKGILRYKV
ncbi:MAG: YkoF family thiamine/hydroxymethylpyrimidine-binding protein [Bacteroidota bacterium]|nr:YkoF family thiamine/hydroxymethylpyrimidine-binding protein [Bacteroidota bacterium]